MNAIWSMSWLATIILYCPHLGRDLMPLLKRIPNSRILAGLPVVPGEAGCLQMHQEAVRIAQAEGRPYVLVLEDDCLLTPSFSFDRLLSAILFAQREGYGVVQGGSVLATNPRKVAAGLLAVDRACSAHFMVYLAAGYHAVLSASQPFDLSIGMLGIRPLLTLPFMAIQKAGKSGIGLPLETGASKTYAGAQNVDYEGMFAMHEQHLLRSFPC